MHPAAITPPPPQPRLFHPRLYLSGPMTGLPELNFPAFHAAAQALRQRGWQVVNPAEINPDGTMPWHLCMRADIKALCDCDAIVLMPGWQRSQGVALELHLAQRLQLEVLSLDGLLTEGQARAVF
jgi:hypothetical protein